APGPGAVALCTENPRTQSAHQPGRHRRRQPKSAGPGRLGGRGLHAQERWSESLRMHMRHVMISVPIRRRYLNKMAYQPVLRLLVFLLGMAAALPAQNHARPS